VANLKTHAALVGISGLVVAGLSLLQSPAVLDPFGFPAVLLVLTGLWFMIMTSYGLHGTVKRVVAAKLLHGPDYLPRSRELARSYPRTKLANELRKHALQVALGGAFVAVVVVKAGTLPVLMFVPALLYTIQWFLFLAAARSVPPAVLMLGISSPEYGEGAHALRGGLHPDRLVAMLDVDEAGARHDIDRLDNFRTSDENWTGVFDILRRQARVVVLYAGTDTPNTEFEARALIALDDDQRLVVIREDGRAPLIDALGERERQFFEARATALAPEAVFEFIVSALRSQRRRAGRRPRQQ